VGDSDCGGQEYVVLHGQGPGGDRAAELRWSEASVFNMYKYSEALPKMNLTLHKRILF
jgi:hypothetical protein